LWDKALTHLARFLLYFLEYRFFLEMVNLLRKFTQFFPYGKIAGAKKGFFRSPLRRKKKRKTKISCKGGLTMSASWQRCLVNPPYG
jgi:hypothetical protein